MLDEEVAEYHADNNIEKLADIMEVIFSVARGEVVQLKGSKRYGRIKSIAEEVLPKRYF